MTKQVISDSVMNFAHAENIRVIDNEDSVTIRVYMASGRIFTGKFVDINPQQAMELAEQKMNQLGEMSGRWRLVS